MIRTPIEFIKIRGKMIRKVARKHIPTSIRKRIRSSFKAYDSNPRKKRNHGLYQLKHQYTIVSAVFNAADYLDDYFSSIFEQTCDTRNISIVLVDDGSSDRSAEIISEWQERHPGRITYYYQVNSGPGAARNKGLGAVSTEWVTFVDSDDKLAPNYFEEVDKAISNHPALILATCRVVHVGQQLLVRKSHHETFCKSKREQLLRNRRRANAYRFLHECNFFQNFIN